MRTANDYINTVLSDGREQNQASEDLRPGRIGPRLARFDVTTHHGLFIVSPDRLSVNSQSNFSTMRANVGLFAGKWMYELQLGSKGVMQVGWGTAQCKFSQESGVGALLAIIINQASLEFFSPLATPRQILSTSRYLYFPTASHSR